jgi:hypothetical protein
MMFLWLLLVCLVGWLLLPPRWEMGALSRLSFAFAAGAAAMSVQMFAFDVAGIGWSRLTLLVPWCIIAGWMVYRRGSSLAEPLWPLRPPSLAPLPVVLLVVTIVPVLVWLPYERLMPLTAWDAWAIWLMKAKAAYLDGTIDGFLSRHRELLGHPEYPLLVPLYATFFYVFKGGVADHAGKALSPFFYLALLGVFYWFARRWSTAGIAMALTAMLAWIPMVARLGFEYSGYAGATLAVYFVAAAGFLVEWYRKDDPSYLAGASLAATAAAWTKNEGQFFLVGVVLLAAAGLIYRRCSPRAWGLLLAPPVLLLGPWILVRGSHGLAAPEFTPLIDFEPDLFRIATRRLLRMALDVSYYNLGFYAFVAASVAAAFVGVSKRFWLLPALVVWQSLGALLAYATGRNDIEWWLGTSADRILGQIAPLALLPVALFFGEWNAKEDADKPTPEPAPARRVAKSKKKRRGR